MKRGILILLGAILLGVITAVAFCVAGHRAAPVHWLRHEFSLTEEQARQTVAMHAEFQKSCAEMCAQVEAADEHLQRLIRSSTTITPEIRAAIAESDRVRSECRTNMLEHFYDVAATLPAEKRERYLEIVMPLVQYPERMAASH